VGAVWDGQFFKVPLLGVQYIIDPANQRINVEGNADYPVSYQAGIVLLTTLSISKGVPPSGRMTMLDPNVKTVFSTNLGITAQPRVARAERSPQIAKAKRGQPGQACFSPAMLLF
jgi:hypothetical protein